MQIIKPNMAQLHNFIDNSTKNNHKRMLSISTDHKHKLDEGIAQAEIAELANLMQAPFDHYCELYANMVSNYGYYQGKTQQVETLISNLGRKSKQWDVWVQNVFMDDTPEYIMIFPGKRGVFQRGTYEMRLETVKALEISLTRFGTLAHVLADVQAFKTNLETARAEQQAVEKKDQDLRIALETGRIALAKVMHRIFGKLLFIYGDQYASIEAYYELPYFQRNYTSANATLKPIPANSRLKSLMGLFKETDQFVITNKGNVPLGFFLTDDELSPTPADMTILQANETQTYGVADLTDGKTARMLLVVNLSTDNARYDAALLGDETGEK